MVIEVKKVNSAAQLQQCLAIRKQVFVEGQQVPLAEEVDGKDPQSEHYLLWVDHVPAGVARVRYLQDVAKIERVAILDNYRGQGLGKAIMQKILTDLKANPLVLWAKLSAQTHAIPFYEQLGFEVCSEEYLDANIPHKDMKLSLRS